ncbi:MAG: transporter substrate-binding domain-containing protein [Methanocorpusculum sp.]|nr:transporter substrate-binding domain-containing protein [Methanocorpusculum sp.]
MKSHVLRPGSSLIGRYRSPRQIPHAVPALILILLLAASAGCVAPPAPAPENITEIVIGTATENYPFSYVDKLGTLTGSDVEIAQWIAENSAVNVTILPMKFAELIPALKSGKIDIILGGMIITPDREEEIDFVREYPSAIHLAAAGAVTAHVSRDAVLSGSAGRAAVIRGSTSETWADLTMGTEKVLACESYDECAEAVLNGSAQIFVANEVTLRALQAQYPLSIFCTIYTDSSAFGAGVRKDDMASKQFITDALRKFYASGEAEMLSLIYGISLESPLKVGIAEDNYPYGYVTPAGTLAGLDIEAISWICETSKRSPEFTVVSLPALSSLLAAGDVDIAAAGLTAVSDDFVKEYPYPAYIGLVTKTGSAVTKADVQNGLANITALEGSAAGAWAKANAGKYIPSYGESSCRILLATDGADVYAGDMQALHALAVRSPAEYTYIGTIYTADDTLGIAVQPGNRELKEFLTARLSLFYASGAAKTAAAKYGISFDEFITVGAARDNPPFTSIEKGVFAGIDIDILDRIAQDTGLRFRIVPLAWEELISAATEGAVDVAVSGLTATEERRNHVYFTKGLMPSTLAFGAPLNSEVTYYDLTRGECNISVVKHSFAEEWANATIRFDNGELRRYDTIESAIAAAKYGAADAVLDDELVMKKYVLEHPDSFKVAASMYTPYEMAFAVSTDRFTLLLQLNEEIKKLKETIFWQDLLISYGIPPV